MRSSFELFTKSTPEILFFSVLVIKKNIKQLTLNIRKYMHIIFVVLSVSTDVEFFFQK